MLWVFVVIAVGVVGLGLLVWYAVTLTRKVADLATEVAGLADQSGRLLDLMEQIELPSENPFDSARSAPRGASDSEADVR
jgi:hypothetical protein